MAETVHCWGVIAAAGSGLRMGAKIPKQYLPINGRAVIAHAIASLLADPRVKMLVVVVKAADPYWDNTVATLPQQWLTKIARADGGNTRAASVLHGLQALHDRGVSASDWVLVHDAARPCLQRSDLARLINTISGPSNNSGTGGLLGHPVFDTLKRVTADGRVATTVLRDGLYHALTPQMFRLGELRQAIQHALRHGTPCTDEAQSMEQAGTSPLIVHSASNNIKITTPADLELAATILKHRQGTKTIHGN